MGKFLGAATMAAALAAGTLGAAPAFADDMNMGGGATCSPSGSALSITAKDHTFDKSCLAVAAGQAFTIFFNNEDSDRHNLAILPSHMATEKFFQGDIVMGPKSITYSVPALKPGTWHFHCEIHPNLMNGTFVVADAPASAPAPVPVPGAATPPSMSMTKPATPPAAAPAPIPAPKASSSAAPAPKASSSAAPAPAPAPKPAMSDLPAPARQGAAAPAPKANAAAKPAGSGLPRTGPQSDRLLLGLSGLALAAGGLSVLAGARRAAPTP